MGNRRKLKSKGAPAGKAKAIALYHDMKVYENFERAATRIFEIVKAAESRSPGAPRWLYLDIQGHRNSADGFDHDAYDLMTDFIMGFLGDYLSKISTPLYQAENPRPQKNDIPDELQIGYPDYGSDYGYDARRLDLKPREHSPVERKSPPGVRAIARYLGMEEAACLVCWHRPVERAHVVPDSLGGSMDVRNFALLCKKHHAESPDVADAESFWAWVDYAELRDSPDTWLEASDDHKKWLDDHGVAVGLEEREPMSFFSTVKAELKSVYGWLESYFRNVDWSDLMNEFHNVMDAATGKHFSIEKKASTHAWAYHVARERITSPKGRMLPISSLGRERGEEVEQEDQAPTP